MITSRTPEEKRAMLAMRSIRDLGMSADRTEDELRTLIAAHAIDLKTRDLRRQILRAVTAASENLQAITVTEAAILKASEVLRLSAETLQKLEVGKQASVEAFAMQKTTLEEALKTKSATEAERFSQRCLQAERDIQIIQAQILAAEAEHQAAVSDVQSFTSSLKELRSQTATLHEEAMSVQLALDPEIATLEAARNEILEPLSMILKQFYLRCVTRILTHDIFVPVSTMTCGKCHLDFPPNVFNHLLTKRKFYLCEGCSSVLYFQP